MSENPLLERVPESASPVPAFALRAPAPWYKHPALWGAVGLAVGVAVTGAAIDAAHYQQSARAARFAASARPLPLPAPALTAPTTSTAAPPKAAPLPAKPKPELAKNPPAKPAPAAPPNLPILPAALGLGPHHKPPKALKGKIAVGGPLFLQPTGGQDGHRPVLPPIPPSGIAGGIGGTRLETVILSVSDPEQATANIRSLTASSGGQSRAYTFVDGKDDSESQGMLLMVPAAKVTKVLQGIGKVGLVASHDSLEGTLGEQRAAAQADVRTALSALKIKRDQMLQTYYEDAPAIKTVDEQIAEDLKALNALQLSGSPKLAFVKVTLK